jgi:hypothetical protein
VAGILQLGSTSVNMTGSNNVAFGIAAVAVETGHDNVAIGVARDSMCIHSVVPDNDGRYCERCGLRIETDIPLF